MAKITDPRKKKKKVRVKVTQTKVGPAPDRSGDGASLKFERGKETRKYTPQDVRTKHKAYGKESDTKPTPDFIKRAQSAQQETVTRNGLVYRAGEKKVTKEPDKIDTHIKVTPDIRPVKRTVEYEYYDDEPTKGRKGKKAKSGKNGPRRMVAGGEDKKGNPATMYGIGKGSGFKPRKIRVSKRPGKF